MRINGPDHFHHQLIALGLSRKNIVLLEAGITLFLGSFAILATGAIRYFALIFVIGIAIILIVLMNIISRKRKKKEEKIESPESKYSY